MKKIISFIVCMCIIILLCACGTSNPEKTTRNTSKEEATTSPGSISKSELNIEDFNWTVEEAKFEGTDYYAFSLVNNSKYNLLGVQIDYSLKEDVSDEELSVFDDFMNEHKDYIEDDATSTDIFLRGARMKYIASGDTADSIPVVIGINNLTWTDIPTTEQFNLMEPKELCLGLIENDETLHLAYYNFIDKNWRFDSETISINKWPSSEIANLIPKPDGHIFTVNTYENINSMDVTVYGVNTDEFSDYITQLKESFTSNEYESEDYFSADDESGNSVSVTYDKYSSSYSISLHGND